MTNDLVKIAKEFPKGFYTVTNKNGEKFTCKASTVLSANTL